MKETVKPDLRFNTINQLEPLSKVAYEYPVTPDSKYIVDDSNFIPMSEAVKQLGSNSIGGDVAKQFYDFPSGEDDGRSVPLSRTKNGKDIAEISSDIMQDIDTMSEKIKKEKDYQNRKSVFEKELSSRPSGADSPSGQ